MSPKSFVKVIVGIAVAAVLPALMAQTGAPPPPAPVPPPPAQAGPPPEGADKLTPQELEDILAPIALYPDVLLAQVLAAATYPMDVVMAARWLGSSSSASDPAIRPAQSV